MNNKNCSFHAFLESFSDTCFKSISSQKQSSTGVLLKKSVLKNFANFIGKHLCQGLF